MCWVLIFLLFLLRGIVWRLQQGQFLWSSDVWGGGEIRENMEEGCVNQGCFSLRTHWIITIAAKTKGHCDQKGREKHTQCSTDLRNRLEDHTGEADGQFDGFHIGELQQQGFVLGSIAQGSISLCEKIMMIFTTLARLCILVLLYFAVHSFSTHFPDLFQHEFGHYCLVNSRIFIKLLWPYWLEQCTTQCIWITDVRKGSGCQTHAEN